MHNPRRNQILSQIVRAMLVIAVITGRHAQHARKALLNPHPGQKHVIHVIQMLTLFLPAFCKLLVNAMPGIQEMTATFA